MALGSDLSDLSDKMSAPVFALTGYAVASLGIPRGFAVPQSGMARVQSYRGGMQRSALPQGYARLFDGCGGMRGAWA